MTINNPKRALILVMSAFVMIGFGIAGFYYSYQNNSVDPRVVKARELYKNYDNYAQENDFSAVFSLLDSIESVYRSIPYYQNSFELGVVENNKAAAYLAMAIYFDSNSLSIDGLGTLSKDTLLNRGEIAVQKSISQYENWIKLYGKISEEGLNSSLKGLFMHGLESYSLNKQKRFIKKRIKEMQDAQLETLRRLSVAYTNLGIIHRHKDNYEQAIKYYIKALELWDRNLAAENNLNILMGKPIKTRNLLDKIFPPEKD